MLCGANIMIDYQMLMQVTIILSTKSKKINKLFNVKIIGSIGYHWSKRDISELTTKCASISQLHMSHITLTVYSHHIIRHAFNKFKAMPSNSGTQKRGSRPHQLKLNSNWLLVKFFLPCSQVLLSYHLGQCSWFLCMCPLVMQL